MGAATDCVIFEMNHTSIIIQICCMEKRKIFLILNFVNNFVMKFPVVLQ